MLYPIDVSQELAMPFGQQPNRDDRLIETLRELFADQSRQISAQGQLLAQQTQRIDAISAQLTALGNQQDSLRNDFNARWQDLPNLYVPRQEQQAMKLDIRTAALEEFRIAATRDLADIRINVQQQVHDAIQTATKDIAAARVAAQEEIEETKHGFDARAITFLVSGISIVVSIGIEVILKIIYH